jgi:Disulphide bond corrector protein DsbC
MLTPAWALLLLAQSSGVLTVAPLERVAAKRGGTFTGKLTAELRQGYHVNSNTPADEYLIPLRLTWTSGPLQVEQVIYPKPQLEKYDFSPKPVSVFSGTFDVVTTFKVPPSAPSGLTTVAGKLRYQACNNKECLSPKTIDVQLPVNIE